MIGKTIGNLRIVKELGKGGMGVVYLAEHMRLDKKFAVKSLSPELTQDPLFRERFYHEAKNQSQLDHVNIVQATDFFEDYDQFFLVMEYVDGMALSELIQQKGKLSKAEALPILRDVLAGLGFAHSKGIIHRDIKPANIMISRDGRARIMDFGIAILAGEKRLTGTGRNIGSPWYMSPEQIARPKEIDYRSDIYSLGVVLFEMLTGIVPFDGETEFSVHNQHINAPPPDPLTLNPAIGEGCSRIILRALAKSPDQRFQSCKEFWQEIKACESKHLSEIPEATLELPTALAGENRPRKIPTGGKGMKMSLIGASIAVVVAAILVVVFISVRSKPVQVATPPPAVARQDDGSAGVASGGPGNNTVKPDAWGIKPQPEVSLPVSAQQEISGTTFRDTLKDGTQGPEMVKIPAGTFTMGDAWGEGETDEKPAHQVVIAKPFALGKYEVTFNDYDVFARQNHRQLPEDNGWGRDQRPVIFVSWENAAAYAEWLSQQTGKRYRLPTEAEWEYAARSGGTEDKWAGTSNAEELDNFAWHTDNSDGKTQPVGRRTPNALGLYDMSGNVYEWVQDCWNRGYVGAPTNGSAWESGDCGRRVIRGGSYFNKPEDVRVMFRNWFASGDRFNYLGFRLARDM